MWQTWDAGTHLRVSPNPLHEPQTGDHDPGVPIESSGYLYFELNHPLKFIIIYNSPASCTGVTGVKAAALQSYMGVPQREGPNIDHETI